MIGIVEDERSCLIDRSYPRAGGRIWLRARMHGKSRKSGRAIGHSVSFPTISLPRVLFGHPAVDEWLRPIRDRAWNTAAFPRLDNRGTEQRSQGEQPRFGD